MAIGSWNGVFGSSKTSAAESNLRSSAMGHPYEKYLNELSSAQLMHPSITTTSAMTRELKPDPFSTKNGRRDMIAMRLRLAQGERWPFQDLETALGSEKVFVFVLQNDQAVVLEDELGLFPSDTLITQLRLIAK